MRALFLLLIAAIPPSPAGGNYLDLSGDIFYLAKDSPSLDAFLGNEWTIEAWIYIRKFPPIPEGKGPLSNFSYILAKPGSFSLILESFFHILDGVKYWESDCFFWKLPGPMLFIAIAGKGIIPGIFNGPAMELNKWHHVAIQQHENLLTSFFDGRVKSIDYLKRKPNEAPWKMPDSDRPLYIGNLPAEEFRHDPYLIGGKHGNVYPFEGAIDELRISNVARYRDGFEIPRVRFKGDIHTMALWHFDEPLGSLRYFDIPKG